MNLDKIQTIFPNFQMESFHKFDTVTALRWETVIDNIFFEAHKNLTLEMTCPDNYKIIIEFIDVYSFQFQGNGQISGFYIEDMSANGYENNVKYKIGDFEQNEAIEFYCADIIVKGIEKIA